MRPTRGTAVLAGTLGRLLGRRAGVRSTSRKVPLIGTELLHEDDTLRVSRSGDPDADTVILCFTGLQQRMGGIGPEEFVASAQLDGASAIFVTDKTRSWFNELEAERVVELLAPHIAGRRIHTLGNSMGGFGAIWITRYLPVSTSLAFAPQFSVHPEIVPDETRWPAARAAISNWRYPSLEDHFVSRTRYVTISGKAGDNVQWTRLPTLPNARHYIVADADHGVAAMLKQHGLLREVIAAAFTDVPNLDAVLAPLAVLRDVGTE